MFPTIGNATLCGDWRGRGAKTRGFLHFLICPRDPLRRSVWSRCKNSRFFLRFLICRATLCGDRRGRGAKTRGVFCVFCGARATLCGDRRGRGAKTRCFLHFFAAPARPSAEIVRVEALSLWRRANSSKCLRTLRGDRACRSALAVAPCDFCCSRNGLWKLSRGLRACFRNLAVAGSIPPLVRGSSGWKIAAFKYKRRTRSVLLQLRLENRNF